ncbi:TfoX/Sxy family protein [Luteimonas soli]|uniref:TfoX/Sxy family protein n=1 Tax=Luteimonas soli TaxID=1648966 RepID=A0ABV7XMK2_9GAMM
MASPDPVIDHLIELLAPLGDAQAKRMFGVRGVYLDGLMVALVADGQVYLKADAENLPAFEATGSLPYAFRSKQRTITSSYWSVPAEALDSSRSLEPWITGALQAARRKAAEPPRMPRAPRLPIS